MMRLLFLLITWTQALMSCDTEPRQDDDDLPLHQLPPDDAGPSRPTGKYN